MDDLLKLISENNRSILKIVILLFVIVGIVLIKKMLGKKQKKKELSRAAEDKLRDEKLNQVILNQSSGIDNRFKEVYKPYDVDYSNVNGKNNVDHVQRGVNHVMVQLVERTELSTRKFMMNPMKTIRVGSDIQDNDINVLAEGISPHQFEIFAIQNKVFIRNLSSENRTVIKRKKEQAIVDEKGIRLLSRDTILLGHVSYDITIIG